MDCDNLNEATPAVPPTESSGSKPSDDCAENENAISSTTSEKVFETNPVSVIERQLDTNESDTDFFASELNISAVPVEKSNENVDDIVQDLENLLENSDFAFKSITTSKSSSEAKINNKKSDVCEAQSSDLNEIPSSSLQHDSLPESIEAVLDEKEDQSLTEQIAQEDQHQIERVSLEDESLVEQLSQEDQQILADCNEENQTTSVDAEPLVLQTDEIFENVQKIAINANEVNVEMAAVEESKPQSSLTEQMPTNLQQNIEEECVNEGKLTTLQKECPSEKLIALQDNTVESQQSEQNIKQPRSPTEIDKELDESCSINSSTGIQIPQVTKDITEECSRPSPSATESETNIDHETEGPPKTEITDCSVNKAYIVTPEAEITQSMEESSEIIVTATPDVASTTELDIGSPIKSDLNTKVVDVEENLDNEIYSELQSSLLANINDATENKISLESAELHKNENINAEVDLNLPASTAVDTSVLSSATDSRNFYKDLIEVEQKSNSKQFVSTSEVSILAEIINNEKPALDKTEEETANVKIIRNTELEQPLTVEVEDPVFIEQPAKEITEIPEEKLTEPSWNKSEKEIEEKRAPLKMTITKNKSENMHSILKIYDPNDSEPQQESHIPKLIIRSSTPSGNECIQQSEELSIPKITIKPVVAPESHQHSPKLTIKPIKPPTSTDVSEKQYSPKVGAKSHSPGAGSPKITIKPVLKPSEILSPLKLTIRSVPNSEEMQCSPTLSIKPESSTETPHHSPKITIKPIIKPDEGVPEERFSPRITIKPVIKPQEDGKLENEIVHSPRLTIKPIKPPEEEQIPISQTFKLNIKPVVPSSSSPKITIKPVTKPEVEIEKLQTELIDFEDQIKQERIVLKIPRNTRKDKFVPVETEKLQKIKLKFSKEGGLAHIISTPKDSAPSLKRLSETTEHNEAKHFKLGPTIDLTDDREEVKLPPGLTITPVIGNRPQGQFAVEDSSSSDDVKIVSISCPAGGTSTDDKDPLAAIPVFEITPESAAAMCSTAAVTVSAVPPPVAAPPAPRKRGRPRKVPLEVREDFKDPKEEEPSVPEPPAIESTRPKRSCRGASVRTTLGIKPRKPRGGGRGGRGGANRVTTRSTYTRKNKEPKAAAKLRLAKESMVKGDEEDEDVEFKQVPIPTDTTSSSSHTDVVIYEEETRMSAENSSRSQTPAKQVLNTPSEVAIEESQSSIQSSTTTESSEKIQKIRKNPRLEVHLQEPEGEVISADKLAEYSWGGGGPYMLQEQVAQYLGIKSFKRKYPDIHRRPVDMQERDFIRETGLASEAMCDMGLTAVKSEDILDIMYTDFHDKYEEYCKHQRDRHAKDVSNKQKALNLAATQEKNKLDIVEQAVQSAFHWNATFNRTRREQRRACMDLQTFTIHYPKGRMKRVNKSPVGNYPLSLVPGQYTDYYKKYTPSELNNLPLNTLGCKNISNTTQDTEESQSDGSGSDSDSSSSDSDSSYSGSSGAEDCKMCSPIASNSIKKITVR